LLNSKSQVTERNAEALREAKSRGVNIVIATGKVLEILYSCSTNIFEEET
jgi:hydroxymethylpyrimidine pyrophosphatase-like HAD family hydrolase